MSEIPKPPKAPPNPAVIELKMIRLGLFMLGATAHVALGVGICSIADPSDYAVGSAIVALGLVQKAIGLGYWVILQRRGATLVG